MSYIGVASIGASAITSILGGVGAKKEAKRQRELQKSIFLTDIALKEKLQLEQLKLLGETERTKIFANSVTEYKIALQEQGTQRLKDTWIYVAGSGLGISLIYGMSLVVQSYTNKNQ
jgi:hypothetical protein